MLISHTTNEKAWIKDSWKRSIQAGLSSRHLPEDHRLSNVEVTERIDKHQTLINVIEKHAYPLFCQIFSRTDSRLILADTNGAIVKTWGQKRFREKLTEIALDQGVLWDEGLKGTNAIGTALVEKRPVSIIGGEHFIRHHHFISCTASPIFSPAGDLIAVLDVTSEYQTHNDATRVLIQNMVQNIESELLNFIPDAALKIRLGHDSSVLNSGWQGIVVTDKNGQVLAQNAIASSVLANQLKPGDPIESVIGSLTLDRIRKTDQFYYQVESVKPLRHLPKSKSKAESSSCPLHQGDSCVEKAWQQATKVMSKRIGLVISGETGTGKNEFVKALHKQSSLAERPLIAINCGALPKDLIESELFGYAPGAFTGAHPKGFEGRFRQANGGILFLDEIADLPLNAQSRLLHVLQEKIVAPIGANRSYPVDVYVIVASHKNLTDMVAKGEFREDLWYRLEGLSITLPSVREREDTQQLIESTFTQESNKQRLSDDVIDLMLKYDWPGNLREVHSTCRLIAALCDNPIVNLDDLPENILRKLTTTRTATLEQDNDLQSTIDNKLLKTIEETNGNVSLASRILGVSRNTIYRKLRKLGIDKIS
ncbi:sigma-54-dependent Fis family transcriptional regulator [Vibrio mediterranei]|uniref:sigma-54-dependent Fis family transcriptional regulator n=1 Tax=Vibrio mediterranei TaxID=689 RepID=UPI001EFDD3C4|nr:sigma-54-dependent Fis family transcriptional regulator [Vibrio mediterranei]MCG9659527.1 sigma-54-dependent Fis family transcriptional regulator [Vibrio mediterranei]MCG9663746.1 sigma-54-dependent Fis family transcriptional regulator [Vibrio mediterranei]